MPTTEPMIDLKDLVAHNIVLARHLAGLSQVQLAKQMKIERTQLADWERGRFKPNDRNLQKIAGEVGQSFSWFYDAHEEA